MRQPKPTTPELIETATYRNLPAEKFLRLEGWREYPPHMGSPNWNDRNGRVIQGQKICFSNESKSSPVQVLIPEGADKEEVIILLKKITRSLRSGWWEELWKDDGYRVEDEDSIRRLRTNP